MFKCIECDFEIVESEGDTCEHCLDAYEDEDLEDEEFDGDDP